MQTIEAVVGVLHNKKKQILIAKRSNTQFMSGFWELPGGKVEKQESSQNAIIRELFEELKIAVLNFSIYQKLTQQYSDRRVNLTIYNIKNYSGTPTGAEGQLIKWVDISQLYNYKLLPTMHDFIKSLTLPQIYWITPSTNHYSKLWMDKFLQKLNKKLIIIQFRSKTAIDNEFIKKLYKKCKQNQKKLLINTIDKTFTEKYCDGWHITTKELMLLKKRPCDKNKLLGASTHNLAQAIKAQNIGVDFITISPIKTTKTHPLTTPLGWRQAAYIIDNINTPAYLLGGMRDHDLKKTLALRAQGIAGVSGLLV